ncbi:dynamin family protein [Tibeticola sp.]|uniref:dynamin family protein n=1 Tax=Tibeticola sp. TaxID=2005368 RepID=UPI0025846AD2|nr:dynamin family protein [Tibeticola sp.]MCI4440141.1 dynamin family protein [Tibeticola sp.]
MTDTTFDAGLGQHRQWRLKMRTRLQHLAAWLENQDLLEDGSRERLRLLEQQLNTDRITVAFVAEFSRGKSETINALFFAGQGRRIMPASAGRTTMCPTEIGYDPAVPPTLRLLPVETRSDPAALAQWRERPEAWVEVALDATDPERLAQALARVTETVAVSEAQARALGFLGDADQEALAVDRAGQVLIPRWRHAWVNLPHPLLEQGLVVLDTPGLNAIGAEPELTLSLLPQAHAVVFLLAADAGVTRSDLAIWQQSLGGRPAEAASRLVVLNKVDVLWDGISAPAVIAEQVEAQRRSVAEVLQLEPSRVLAISAQKGLLAKLTHNEALLHASGLPRLERMLADEVLGRRQEVLRASVRKGLDEVQQLVMRTVEQRQRELTEQYHELASLRGKNEAVIRQMRARIAQEEAEFKASAARIHALRSVHLKRQTEMLDLLSTSTLKREMAQLRAQLAQPGFKLHLGETFRATFDRLRSVLTQVQEQNLELQGMLSATFSQLNAEFGFSLQAAEAVDVSAVLRELDAIEQAHRQYLGLGQAIRLARAVFAEQLMRALAARVRAIFEALQTDIELWSKAATAQLDAQLKERRKAFQRRREAVERIENAAGGLEDRLREISERRSEMDRLRERVAEEVAFVLAPTATGEPMARAA